MDSQSGASAPQQINPTVEVGSTGLRRFGGYVWEEFLRELSGIRGPQVFREMSENDAIVSSVLFAIEMVIRKVDWSIEAVSSGPEDQADAEFVESVMDDMSQSWSDTIAEILSFLRFGWSWHEIVYKIRGGPQGDAESRSRYSDGKIGWRKIPIRAQETLWQWRFDDSGGIQAMIQSPPPDYRHRWLPIEKCLLFRTTNHKGNPQGRSILRGAYRSWFFKKHLENIEAIGVERDLAGIPIVWVPPHLLDAKATAEQKQVLEAYKRLATNVKRDEQEGIVFPLAYDENGHKLYDFTLLATGGTRQFDTTTIINRYNQSMAMVVLADFILLGHEQVGSFALSSSKTDLFTTAVGAWCECIAEVFNRHAIPRLFDLNNMQNRTKLPRLVHGDVGSTDLTALGDYISKLAGAGMPLFPHKDLEDHLKRQARLPVQEEDDQAGFLDDQGRPASRREGMDGDPAELAASATHAAGSGTNAASAATLAPAAPEPSPAEAAAKATEAAGSATHAAGKVTG